MSAAEVVFAFERLQAAMAYFNEAAKAVADSTNELGRQLKAMPEIEAEVVRRMKMEFRPQGVAAAKAAGFTGIPCEQCGSLKTRRMGTCLRCVECNWDGGCG